MSDSGDDPYERYFRASGPDGPEGADGYPGGGGPGGAAGHTLPLRAQHRRAAPSPAQERLMARIAAGRKARQRRAWLVASGLVSALVLLVSGAGWALTGYVNHMVARVSAGTSAAAAGAPLNILVAGVDRRTGLTRREQLRLHVGRAVSANSDTMMLVHVSPAHSRVTVVSLPRDSWVDIPGHGMNKINAAYGIGGPRLMVRTVEQATGLTVNNYVEVNFLAFVKVIDALGGVNVCLPEAVDDPSSGLRLPAGRHHVDGITALEYARDRHSFPLEDLARIQDQQSLVSTALGQLIGSGTLANPIRMAHLLSAVLPALRVDKSLNVAALADELRGITARDVVFLTVPLANTDYLTSTGQDAVLWNTAQARRLFGEISRDQPVIRPPAPPSRHGKHARRGRISGPGRSRPPGWVPPGARTAAQAACR